MSAERTWGLEVAEREAHARENITLHHTAPLPLSHSIDQTNIDASLLCLPVFLASCQRLLVLAGTTYTTRM